jgi:hypothetical protein
MRRIGYVMKGELTFSLADSINTIPDASCQGLQFGFIHLLQETKINISLQKPADNLNQPIFRQNLFRPFSSHF